MYNKEILNRVITLFSAMSDVDEITADSELIDDLGISSMDILFLISKLEAEFSISVPEKEIRKLITINDVVELVTKLSK